MTRIDYFFTPMSPFTYLSGARLEDIAARHGAEVAYKPLDGPALFVRTGGQQLKDRHPARQAYRLQELRRAAVKAGVKLDLKPAHFPVAPAPASYAIIAAIKAGGGDLPGLVQAFPRAVWAEGRNIADEEVVREVLAAHGFDPAINDRFMLAAAETYVANLEEAVARGVFGVPFYIVGDEMFWGQDRLDDLDAHLGGRL